MLIKVIFLILSLIGLSGLYFGQKIPAQLDQVIFMKEVHQKSYGEFEKKFGKKSRIVLVREVEKISKNQASLFENEIYAMLPETARPNDWFDLSPYLNLEANSVLLLDYKISHFQAHMQSLEKLGQLLSQSSNKWFVAGQFWTSYQLKQENEKIQQVVFPLLFALMTLITLIILRSWKLTLFTMAVCFICTGWSFWFISWIFKEIHLLTSLVPLICFVIPLALCFHFIWGLKVYKSWKSCLHYKTKAVVMTSLTTLVGFASLSLSDIKVIRDFSGMASLGLTFSFLWVVLSFWICQNLVSAIVQKTNLPSWKNIKENFLIIQRIPKTPVWCFSLFMIASGFYVIHKIEKVIEAEKFFAKDHSLSVNLRKVSEKLNGLPVADVLIESPQKITFEDWKIIHSVEKKIVAKWPEIHLMSPTILLSQVQLTTTGNEGLPTTEFMATMKMNALPHILLSEMSREKLFKISLLSKDAIKVSQKDWKAALDDLVSQLKIAFPQMQVEKTGLNYFVTESQLDLLQSLLKSFFVGFFLTTLVTGFLMRDSMGIAIFVLVNIAPLAATLLFFPLLNLTLNMTTIMTFSICFGLIVDGTLHLLLTKDVESEEKLLALESPIFFSNVILILAFLVLLAHSFAPVWQFGLVISLILFWGLVFDLVVLPLLKKDTPKI